MDVKVPVELGEIFESKKEERQMDKIGKYLDLFDEYPDLCRPLYDSPSDVKFFKAHAKLTTPRIELSLDCLPWDEMINSPITVPLPCFIYFEPKTWPERLPNGKLWGVLMTFTNFGFNHRPHSDGIVFVCADQTKDPPFTPHLSELWKWALNHDNCPPSMRFASLAYALKVLCSSPQSPFPLKSTRKDSFSYYQGSKTWKNAEWDMTLEELLRDNVTFFNYSDELSAEDTPLKPKFTRKKRKRSGPVPIVPTSLSEIPVFPAEKDKDNHADLEDWSSLDIGLILSSTPFE
jgi:hypothetical protein